MQDQFVYTCDDVLRMLDALLEVRDGTWWDEFFADTFAQNHMWCEIVALACELLAWTQCSR